MRKLFVAVGLALCLESNAQTEVKGQLFTGMIITVGENIGKSFSYGFELGGGVNIKRDKLVIGVDFSGELYQNTLPNTSSFKDRLILLGPSLQAGWKVAFNQMNLVPFLNLGYTWGTNSLTDGKLFPDNSIDLINMRGLSIGPGISFEVGEKASLSLSYLFYSPSYTVTQEAQSSIAAAAAPTQLYGPVVTFPESNFKMDRMLLRFTWTL